MHNTSLQDFRNRCNTIGFSVNEFFGKNYFDSSDIYVADKYNKLPTDMWIIRGNNNDFVAKFDHEPTDKEIHNAICNHNGFYHKMI